MERIDFWKLCDEYSIMNAALLFSGFSPRDVESNADSFNDKNYPGYVATRTALCGAIISGRIRAVHHPDYSEEYSENRSVDVRNTLIAAGDLDRFFRDRGYVCEYFDRRKPSPLAPETSSPRFPVKLAAANKAWTAVTSNPALMAGKSPKQALTKWLRDNAADLGLLKKDGSPNNAGIEEICKVANWKPEGGAPSTPTQDAAETSPSLVRVSGLRQGGQSARLSFFDDTDDEIPF